MCLYPVSTAAASIIVLPSSWFPSASNPPRFIPVALLARVPLRLAEQINERRIEAEAAVFTATISCFFVFF